MLIYPWLDSQGGSWTHVQLVWDRWQTLNAGALAFLASLVAFNISRFNENLQRERDFVAAKAYLPSTLSSLMDYCARSASIYVELWDSNGQAPNPISHPDLPHDYREVFSNCIRHADPVVGSYLSNILVRLQVHDARLRDALSQTGQAHSPVIDKMTLISYLYRLGELYALIGNLFSFARNEEAFQEKRLKWEDLRNAYGILNIEIDDVAINDLMNLRAFAMRALKRA
ncbi:hypothetical protein [Methyloversatilis sp.]|uniref:hypothetical protein n=1 Tax=Methyloversatilis sp. TaxID=2569862 RepID=UPI0027B91A2B|nr:hypothetical protein [Methyloversatilis sp.]